jgi:TRAP-type mannitol/chloroaromatic compound transport system permease small subunit
MMVLTCIVVTARYVFNIGAIPVQESVVYLHGSVFMLGIAYTLQQSGHVRVDILYQNYSPRVKALANLFGTLVFLMPLAIFIFWTSLDYVAFSWSLKESSPEPGGLPFIYLLKTLIPIMAFLLLLQGIAELLRNFVIVAAGKGKK